VRCAAVLALLSLALGLVGAERAHGQPLPTCDAPGLSGGDFCFDAANQFIGGPVCQFFSLFGVLCPIPHCATPGIDVSEPCFDDSGLVCGYSLYNAFTRLCTPIDINDAHLVVGSGPMTPSCGTASLASGDLCANASGQLCASNGAGGIQGCSQEFSCSSPEQLVQHCLAASLPANPNPLLQQLTADAVQSVLGAHQLPAGDAARVTSYARDSLRAYVFTALLEIVKKDAPDAEEQQLIQYYADKVKELRVRQAGVAEDEYYKYALSPCDYTPPAGFTFQKPTDCATPFGALFGTPAHPSIEEFQAYGIAKISKQELLDDPEAQRLAESTSRAIALGVSLAVAGLITLGVFAWLSLSVTALATSIVAAIFPFGIFGASLVAGAAAPVFAILLAIIGSIFAVIHYDNYNQFVSDATSLQSRARAAVIDLKAEVETERGILDLYHVFIKSTQPEFDPPAPPAPQPDAPKFVLMDEAGAQIGIVPSIALAVTDPAGWDTDPPTSELTTRLDGGWFVPTTRVPNNGSVEERSTLSLSLSYIDWNGKPGVAWRKGGQFLIPQNPSQTTQFGTATVTDTLQLIDASGQRVQLRIATNQLPSCELKVPVRSFPVGSTAILDGSRSQDGDGTIVSWAFTCGNGSSPSPAGTSNSIVTCTYPSAGHFVATLVVTDDDGQSSPVCKQGVDARANRPPAPKLTVKPSTQKIGLAMTLNGCGSTDPDGAVASYTFDPGDGTGLVTTTAPTCTAAHAYTAAGNFKPCLVVSDDAGASSKSVCTTVTVKPNRPPTANFDAKQVAAQPRTISFLDKSKDDDGTVTAWEWTFGDGGTSTAQNPTHTYASAPSVVPVCLKVTDNSGAISSAKCRNVNVK
jgi:PKD repeat protein